MSDIVGLLTLDSACLDAGEFATLDGAGLCVDEVCPICDSRGLSLATQPGNPFGGVTIICRSCGRAAHW